VRRGASGLAALGIRNGDVVAQCSPNSPEFGIAFHAVACLGATLTPMNPANTAHELAHQLIDSEAKWMIGTTATEDKARNAIKGCGRTMDFQEGTSVPDVIKKPKEAQPQKHCLSSRRAALLRILFR
jgi:acyl-CoA synthetase (AMP-forming)/AMP-acid ligase II